MDRLRTERHPGVWHKGGLESDGVKGRGVGLDSRGGWADVHGCVEERRGRRDWTSPGEERGNETGKVIIAHGNVESGTTVRNKRHGAEDSSGQDRMGGYTRWPEAYLVTLTDRCSFLCVSGQRGTIAKSMHEEHLCVVALTSMERGTQFFPLASYRLV